MVEWKLLDPVTAYDRIAPSFRTLAEPRRAYLDQIERLIVSHIPRGSRTLLDVGAGDGSRAIRIACQSGISEVTLLEPSAAMRRRWPVDVRRLEIRAEDLTSVEGSFDVILCLWNVIGHVFPAAKRAEVLCQFARLAPRGRIFMDVNHRYNIRQYGILPTLGRRLYDWICPGDGNGDVTVTWSIDNVDVATRGHVFIGPEFMRLIAAAGLRIGRQYIIDYSTGELCQRQFQGNLLYLLESGLADSRR